MIWVLVQKDNLSNITLIEYSKKPSVDELTKITSDPQASIDMLKGACVEKENVTLWVEEVSA